MNSVKINFSPDRIKFIMQERIKDYVFANNGIIFGGFVRDEIIRSHYKTIYNGCNSYNSHHFWNKLYQPETAARTIVANDIDVCMYSAADISKFIDDVHKLFNNEVGASNVISSDLVVSSNNEYISMPIECYRKLNFTITVGKIPYVSTGVELSFDIDIIMPKNIKRQPPFKKIDFLCNVFIMSTQGIVISKETGTIIDNMSILDKQKISCSIMKDIVEFKTEFCMENSYNYDHIVGDFSYNNKVYKRLYKMMFRSFKWNISNIPFEICDQKGEHNNVCNICLSNFKNKTNRVIKMFNNNSSNTEKVCTNIAHDKCIFKYFETQLEGCKQGYDFDATENFAFKCPVRNVINFKDCAKNITAIINEKMK
jgi:hypothetical protein